MAALTKLDNSRALLEKSIVVGLITSDEFISKVREKIIPNETFETPFAQSISEWCIEFYDQYGKAPGKTLEAIYSAKKRETPEVKSTLIARTLRDLSTEYDKGVPINIPYLLAESEKYFNHRRLKRLAEDLEMNLLSGNTEGAERLLSSYHKIDLGVESAVNPFQNVDAIQEAFERREENILRMPGALGEFFDGQLLREGFIAFQGPEKRGKSWFLLEMAYRALRQRRTVAYFEAGDMGRNQTIRRLMVRLTGVPDRISYCGPVEVPVTIAREEDEEYARVLTETRMLEKCLTWKQAYRKSERFMKACKIAGRDTFKLISYPNSTLTVKTMAARLQQWEREEGFIPDVIVVDYADILAPEDSGKDFRNQVNDTWKALRRLSQEKKVLLFTATQANTASYSTGVQGMGNFSEDKRKLSHVTGMVGLNQKEEEKRVGVMRLNWIVLREGEYYTSKCCFVSQCLRIGRPMMQSCW